MSLLLAVKSLQRCKLRLTRSVHPGSSIVAGFGGWLGVMMHAESCMPSVATIVQVGYNYFRFFGM